MMGAEVLHSLNQADKFMVDDETHTGPFYIPRPLTQEPDWALTSISVDLGHC